VAAHASTPASERKATAYLRAADPVLARVIDAVGPLGNSREGRPDRGDHYGALVRSIASQQLSVLAARAIYGRLTERFGGRAPTPQEILDDDPEELRARRSATCARWPSTCCRASWSSIASIS
jgi:DNA-3-methyladenine glycosylase II